MAGRRAVLASRAVAAACVLAVLAVAAAAAAPSMAAPAFASAGVQAQRANDAKIVPDIVDTIAPSVQLRVTYADGASVAGGERLSVVQMAAKPQVAFEGADPKAFYTFMLVDPDAPDPADPTYRSWLHWLVVDLPGGAAPTQGRTLMPYKGPSPPKGVHRYAFLLFKQPAEMGTKRAEQAAPPERNSFNVRAFAGANKLGDPAGVAFYEVEKPAARHKEH